MESGFHAVILFSSLAVYSSHSGFTDWEDVVVVKEGMPATLGCTDTTVRGAVAINWMAKSLGADEWKLVLSASEMGEFSGGASKPSMRLTDPNFRDTGVFTLFFLPRREDGGLYSCLIKQQERKLRERIILLAILTVTVFPAAPIPQRSTLRLIASVNPIDAATKITWAAPGSISIKSEKILNTGTVAKLPQVLYSDHGPYICMVHPSGNSSNMLFAFNVDVIVDADNVASFTDITHEREISTATQAQTPHPVICPNIPGDYVQLYWQPPDGKHREMRHVFEYDRWRGSTLSTEHSKKLKLAGPPYNAETGSFSFLLTPGLRDGGLYICNVILNDNCISQSTRISVLKVKTSRPSSKLELECLYSETSQVQSVSWKHQNKSQKLRMSTKGPGHIVTVLPLPITSDTAGNYTCTLQLKNGQTVRGMQVVTLPQTVVIDEREPTPSLLPSLSALLLLVPLVAAAVGVLLWRQKHISDRGIEQSLSVHPSDAENIYENPEDMRQTPPQGSVYMDLKPRGEDDVYKELERY
ncbi:g6f-like [Centropristis striata]|uniref:g6f-like n=1 Tax=Centropristis striata TaxID=184440 RepID=UPI0027DFB2B4|nr:g6f-like [Centropristis striata]